MLDSKIFTRKIKKYTVYNVTRLKNKYGFRILFEFDDNTEKIKQHGGYSTQREAKNARDNIVTAINNNEYVLYDNIRVYDFLDYWLNNIKLHEVRTNTFNSYKNIVYNYSKEYFGNLYLTQLNVGHINNFVKFVSSQALTLASWALITMSNSLKYAKKYHLVSMNVAKGVKVPREILNEIEYKKKNKVKETLSVEQVKLLIDKCRETKIYIFVLFAVLMGFRKSEIRGLKFSDIDFIKRKIHLQRQIGTNNKIDKKQLNPKKGQYYTKQEMELKTKRSERTKDIPDLVFEAILEQKTLYNQMLEEKNNGKRIFFDNDYICFADNGTPRGAGFVYKTFNKILKDNNLPAIKFHGLRHVYTTLLLTNNISLKAVSAGLGHSRVDVTTKNYFDKGKIIIDCSEVLNEFAKQVVPVKEDKIYLQGVLLNDIFAQYIP